MNPDQRTPIFPSIRVVKIGGSLLDSPQGMNRVQDWLNRSRNHYTLSIAIAGGGLYADVVRRLDQRYRLEPSVAHWLAIRAMSLQACVLTHVTGWPLRADWHAFAAMLRESTTANGLAETPTAGGICLFDVELFLREVEPGLAGGPLPVGWHVTSDSIAARVASTVQVFAPTDLELLKSCRPPAVARTYQDAVAAGYVDTYFPNAAAELDAVRCVAIDGQAVKAERPTSWTLRRLPRD